MSHFIINLDIKVSRCELTENVHLPLKLFLFFATFFIVEEF